MVTKIWGFIFFAGNDQGLRKKNPGSAYHFLFSLLTWEFAERQKTESIKIKPVFII